MVVQISQGAVKAKPARVESEARNVQSLSWLKPGLEPESFGPVHMPPSFTLKTSKLKQAIRKGMTFQMIILCESNRPHQSSGVSRPKNRNEGTSCELEDTGKRLMTAEFCFSVIGQHESHDSPSTPAQKSMRKNAGISQTKHALQNSLEQTPHCQAMHPIRICLSHQSHATLCLNPCHSDAEGEVFAIVTLVFLTS